MSQQRKLLKLGPELQALVSRARCPSALLAISQDSPHAEQAQAWDLEVQRRAAAERAPRAPGHATPRASPQPSPDAANRFTAVNQTTSQNGPAPDPGQMLDSPEPGNVLKKLPDVPDPHSEPEDVSKFPKPVVKRPWDDGASSMDIFFEKLEEDQCRRAIARYVELLGTAEGFIGDLAAATDPSFRAQVADLLLKEM